MMKYLIGEKLLIILWIKVFVTIATDISSGADCQYNLCDIPKNTYSILVVFKIT